jgi:hypothetical protein
VPRFDPAFPPPVPIFYAANQRPFTFFFTGRVLGGPPIFGVLPLKKKHRETRTHDPVFLSLEIKHRPSGADWLRNMELSLGVPLRLGEGRYEGNGDLDFGVLYQFVREQDWVPTIAVQSKMRIPSGDRSSGVDGTFTGILSHTLGPGVVFLNGSVATINNNTFAYTRRFQWSVVPGYRLPINEQVAVIADYVHRSNPCEGRPNQNILEIAAQIQLAENMILGPGVLIGLDGHGRTPNLGAGLVLQYAF